MTYYVGAASGRIWKSIGSGIAWKPIFDDKPVMIPRNPRILFAGPLNLNAHYL